VLNHHKVELKISYDRAKLEKLYTAKGLFEQDSNHVVEMDVFIDTLVEAFSCLQKFKRRIREPDTSKNCV